MLDKRLQLGGLQVGGPRTMQNSARFRVANNVYQTRDNYMIPRFSSSEYLSAMSGATSIIHAGRYKDKPIFLATGSDGRLIIFYESSTMEISSPLPIYVSTGDGIQSYEKLGNYYFLVPNQGLFKFDGVHAYRAGSPVPWALFSSWNTSGTRNLWVKLVLHHTDFQGNAVHSGDITVNVNKDGLPGQPNTVAIDTGRMEGYIDAWYYQNKKEVRPEVEKATLGNGFISYFMKVESQTSDPVNSQIICNCRWSSVKVGVYLVNYPQGGIGYSGANPLLDDVQVVGVAYRVKEVRDVGGGYLDIVLDLKAVKYMDYSGEWKEIDFVDSWLLPSAGAGYYLANYWISVWASNTETGTYVAQSLIPSCNDSESLGVLVTHRFDVEIDMSATKIASWRYNLFNIPPILGDFYDVTTEKRVFTPDNSKSFTEFSEMGMISYENEIYHSDVTLGGSFEMTTALSFVVVGDQDDGGVQSICGSSDFLFVSRKYRNYYLSGNIPTANYRTQNIPQTDLGAYSNESSILSGDKILFLNSQGIWALYLGGRCEEVSSQIAGLFNNFSNTLPFDEERYFDLSEYPTYAEGGKFLRTRIDNVRNLLGFFIKGEDGLGEGLILNLNNGEFYTWSGMYYGLPISGVPNFSDILFIDGDFYLPVNTSSEEPSAYKEDKSIPRPNNYMGAIPSFHNPRLKTTWFTGGEPSLEKKTKQVKVWGTVVGEIGVKHSTDFSRVKETDDGIYSCTDSDLFSHKRRMESENALSCSVELEFSGDRFEIEGLEIEFEPFQGGMKR